MNKKNIFLWTLYDFANSIAVIVFFLYFSQWLVIDKGVSDFWYNMIFAVGSLLLLLTAPVFGSIADKTGRQQNYLNRITILVFFFFLLVTITALFFSEKVFLAALFFLIANYLYQFSFVFYNALLPYIASPEIRGRISGLGQAGNWIGQIAGLLITLPFAAGTIYIMGETGRAQTFFPAVIIFFILAVPMLLFFRLPKHETYSGDISLKNEYKNYWGQFKELIKAPGMGLFLLSYFFFNDAIITASNNFPIYLQNVYSVTDATKSMLLVGILATSAIGAFCFGFVADKIGLKRTLMIVVGSFVIIFPLLGLSPNFTIFVILSILMGFFFGAIWTVTRATMVALCPKEKMNFGFSFYTVVERVSTIIGPLSWGLITYLFFDLGIIRYKIAVTSMAIFVLIGLYLLKNVEIKENTGSVS